jgi:hypothetical protein
VDNAAKLMKPFKLEDLLQSVATHLRRH